MPQIDENQASPTITALVKRVIAGAVDLTLIAIPTMVVAFAASERFQILEMRNGRARFELADQLRINEIDNGLNRATQLGDTVYALSGVGLVLTIATVMMMTLLVFVLMPALQQGQTPGRSILRLPIRQDAGSDEGAAVAIIDTADEARVEPIQPSDQPATPLRQPTETTKATTTDVRQRPKQPRGRLVVDITNEVAATRADDDPVVGAQPADPPGRANVDAAIDVADGDPANPEAANAEPEPETGENPNGDQLRALVQAGLDRSEAMIQVTLGNDEDYAGWADLDALNLTDRAEGSHSDPNPFETLTLPESSLSETPLTASTSAGTTVTVAVPVEAAQDEQAPITPEWSAELHAWIFHDTRSDRLFRHDQDQGRWIPIT